MSNGIFFSMGGDMGRGESNNDINSDAIDISSELRKFWSKAFLVCLKECLDADRSARIADSAIEEFENRFLEEREGAE